MARVVIAAQNLLGAGAKVVGHSLLPALCRELAGEEVRVLLPDTVEYRALDLDTAERRYFPLRGSSIANDLARMWQLYVTVPNEVREFGADVCLTLGDLGPISLPCRHIIFLHQPLLVYSDYELHGSGGWSAWKRRYMMHHFGRSARNAFRVLVQTSVMAERVERQYGVAAERVGIVPQPVPRAAEDGEVPAKMAASGAKCKLLFLAQYYAHKNHAALPAVCEELRRRGLGDRVHFFLTLNEADAGDEARRLLSGCAGMASNLGVLSRGEVYAALKTASALFLPTLVESYGLIYLEAMSCGTPVLTSDRDFARWMCGDLARYFDPLDAAPMAEAIEKFVANGTERLNEADVEKSLRRFPADWPAVAKMFVGFWA